MDMPLLEREYSARGFSAVAGVDEVGRGPLAGPVVCAAVILPLEEAARIAGIDDSKRLSPKKREALALRIRETARAFAVSEVSEAAIDEMNILQATRLGMKRAIERNTGVPYRIGSAPMRSLHLARLASRPIGSPVPSSHRYTVPRSAICLMRRLHGSGITDTRTLCSFFMSPSSVIP